MRRVVLGLVLAAAAAVALPGPADAATPFQPCPGDASVECASVAVPLDRTGAVAGELTLDVRRIVARPSRGVMLFVQGGPGAPGTRAFDVLESEWRSLFPGYTIAAFDMRGTGRFALRCERLENEFAFDSARIAEAAEVCASTLGQTHGLYTTRAAADDLDAIRQALDVDRIGLYGVSYGTKLSLAYALTYPAHVERLLLDSVLLPSHPDPFSRSTIAAIPSVLASICAGSLCRRTTPTPVADFVTLANRLAARPLRGVVIVADDGRRESRTMTVEQLFQILSLVDVDAGIRAALPAAVRAAVRGDATSLLRLQDLLARADSGSISPADFSIALAFANICEDSAFPWARSAPFEGRLEALQAAAAQLPPAAYAPFGSWAATLSTFTRGCLRWPQAPVASPLGAGPLPDVPVLALGGDLDLRTPAADSRAAAQLFPRGRFLLLPGGDHGVVGRSRCVDARVLAWIERDADPAPCPRLPPAYAPAPRPPLSLAELAPMPGVSGKRGRTLRAVVETLADVGSMLRLTGGGAPIGGLRGGRFEPDPDGALLRRFSYIRGVWVSGRVTIEGAAGPRLDGLVTVGGSAASPGKLRVSTALAGTLAGKAVRVRRP